MMEDKFNKLKNGLKLKIALAFVITTIFAALFLTLGIKNKNGITLIALVISIIVMLILAGVSFLFVYFSNFNFLI